MILINYIKKIDEKYSILRLLQYSLLLSIVALAIDILDLPSKLIIRYGWKIGALIGIGSVIYVFLVILQLHIVDAVKMIHINVVDCILIVVLFSLVLYIGGAYQFKILNPYKLIYSFIIILSDISGVIFRLIRYIKNIKHSGKYKSNIVDLKSIYDSTFSIHNNTILVEERDVDYDLLGRQNVINQLFNLICRCKPDEHFVISLEGKWGSGKTTIIKNVENKIKKYDKNIVIIDEFDPWTYSSKETMLYAMFDILLKKTGYKYSEIAIKQTINKFGEAIIGNYKKMNILKSTFKNQNELEKIKVQINEYLALSEKQVVFFIDNIDRADSENIILLFKLVGNVFDFKRVTYVLSFDNERVEKIFNNNLNIDYEFLKKVIQMPIKVPTISKDELYMVINECCNNLFEAYGESDESIKKYKPIVNCIISHTENLRDFKRLINSVISTVFAQDTFLNKRDLFAIEYIRLYNFELYKEIYENRQYFISHDKIADSSVYSMSFNKKKFNSEAKDYFNKLFNDANNRAYLEVLKTMFAYVEKYESGQELVYEGIYYHNSEDDMIARGRRICSAKYFDLYFTYTENDYVAVDRLVVNLVNNMNELNSVEEKRLFFDSMLNKIDVTFQVELIEKLQLYLNDFNVIVSFDIIKILYESEKIDNSSYFFRLSPYSRTQVIVWNLLQVITAQSFSLFVQKILNDYKKINYIDGVNYWFKHDNEGKNMGERKTKWQSTLDQMIITILENNINIYDDEYYDRGNIWVIYRANKENPTIIKNYVQRIISSRNIFRLLYDIIGVSQGRLYRYSILESNLNALTDVNRVDQILIETKPKTEDEKFILDIYNEFKSGQKDSFGENGIYRNKEIKLNL